VAPHLVVALASGKLRDMLGWELLCVTAPERDYGGGGMLVLWLFGRHLAIRLGEA